MGTGMAGGVTWRMYTSSPDAESKRFLFFAQGEAILAPHRMYPSFRAPLVLKSVGSATSYYNLELLDSCKSRGLAQNPRADSAQIPR